MANALETTFKNLQSDERYKKLERTLKMALLKNAERRSTDNGNAGTWPNVSSINGDHLDTSLAAMSIHSSRISSEVVSSSTNLRNILLNKQRLGAPRNSVATSSENQFPTRKSGDDSAMMPPPRTPGLDFGRTKKSSGQSQRVPLLNMPVGSGRNTNGFSVSTPASSISSIPKCMGTASINTSTVYQENNDYHERNAYGDADTGSAPKQERNFSRWRVLLNDKGLLIIKGTLDCGKVARSKPVIRRLTPTSVQSVFKHTYHLQGNLVDERDELPDYVRGKFYNGFPDDWENVYQVWRNFVNDGNRLSFRWPTAVTDSDDDIKSGVTEISYRPERFKKTVSPRKRNRSAKSSLSLSSEVDTENRLDGSSCLRSHNSSGGTLEKSAKKNYPPPENSPRSHSKSNVHQDRSKTDEALDEKSKSHDYSAASLNTTEKNSVTSLANYLSEDKLNTIIDNLTDKNCPLEYIHKIVQMFDCMKYVATYQSPAENEAEKGNFVSSGEKETTRSPKKANRSTENKGDRSNTSNSTNHVNSPRPSAPKSDQYDNQSSLAGGVSDKSYDNHSRQTRRELTQHDYESSESDNDFYDGTRRSSTQRFPASNGRHRKTHKHRNPADLAIARQSREYTDPVRSSNDPRRQYTESPPVRSQNHDSSISDDEFAMKKKRESSSVKRGFLSPRNVAPGKENRRELEYYDSSISITEDESRYPDRAKNKNTRKDNYDSSVSITEDEHGDARNRMNSRKYYPEPNSRPLEPARKRLDSLDYYADSLSPAVDKSNIRSGNIPDERKRQDFLPGAQDTARNSPLRNSRVPRKTPVSSNPIAAGDARALPKTPNPTSKDPSSTDNSNANYPVNTQEEDSSYWSADAKHSKKLNAYRELTEIKSSEPHTDNRSRQLELERSSESPETPPAKSKTPQVRRKMNANRELPDIESQPELEESLESPEMPPPKSKTPQVRKKMNSNRELTDIESQPELDESLESPEMPPPKSKTPQVRKKPIVLSTETVEINLKAYSWQKTNSRKEIDKNAGNTPRKSARNEPISQKSPVDVPEPTKAVESVKPNTRSKDKLVALKVQDDDSSARENKTENAVNPKGSAVSASAAEYGSEENPKLLTAWVPAVICDDDGDKKCHLIFEGKLLNEAGHVANRKFETGIVRRRLSPKIIETINHEFYKLVGDLNDTKHVVPKELIKLCHSGCPGRIGQFCERWKSLTGEIYKSPPQDRTHNTSVDCLSVPRSSRGRRILPPLNYWSGERMVTKDNKTIYSPGNSQESSIPSSLETTNQEVRKKKKSPEARSETKRTIEAGANDTKKKEAEKISTPSKAIVESPPQPAIRSQKPRASKRRLTRNRQVSSSESDGDAEVKPTPRKRKSKANDKDANVDSTRKLRDSGKNIASSQRPEQADISPRKGSFEKSSGSEVKAKYKKRQKIDDNQSTLQQFVTRRPSEVKCTYLKNVPMHDGDLSEDQLSTM